MVRQKPNPKAWTPNQIVASNISRARLLRGWTQDQASEALAPYFGTRVSAASWSAMERSVDGGRIREFTADDLFALARGFALPIGFFLTPPSGEAPGVAAPDAGRDGLDPMALLDVVLGTEESLAEWRVVLLTWGAVAGHRARLHPDGRMEILGRVVPDVHQRLEHPAALRAQMLLREQFGDLDAARDVLERVVASLDALDQSAPDGTGEDEVTPTEPAPGAGSAPTGGAAESTGSGGRVRRPPG